MPSQLEKALKLAKKTGDRLIVFDSPDSDNAFVVMNLEEYEDIMTCECECECDHDHHGHGYADEDEDDDDAYDPLDYPAEEDEADEPSKESYAREVAGLTEEELLDKINRDIALWKESQQGADLDENEAAKGENQDDSGEEQESGKTKSKWAIRSDIKENADEIIEEDRHYLEEVKY